MSVSLWNWTEKCEGKPCCGDCDLCRCENCEYYDQEEHYCTYIICAPGYCEEPLPCEKEDV